MLIFSSKFFSFLFSVLILFGSVSLWADSGLTLRLYPLEFSFDRVADYAGFGSPELYLKVEVAKVNSKKREFVGYYPMPNKKSLDQKVILNQPVFSISLIQILKKVCSEEDYCPLSDLNLFIELVESSKVGDSIESLNQPVDSNSFITNGVVNFRSYEQSVFKIYKNMLLLDWYNKLHPNDTRRFYSDKLMSRYAEDVDNELELSRKSRDRFNMRNLQNETLVIQPHPYLEDFYKFTSIYIFYYFAGELTLSH